MTTAEGLVETSLDTAVETIRKGGLLIYPTEAVYGLGCDYRSSTAVERLLELKQRPVDKGLILAASHVEQILPLIRPNHGDELAQALKTWPGHHTWVFRASSKVPAWISGAHSTVAVRVSSHPVIKKMCDALGHAIVSTSANPAGVEPSSNIAVIKDVFGPQVDYYLDLPLGEEKNPSQIHNAVDGLTLRL
ncbi:L-threonylcarbamoyladenylate synthase [Marinicella sp. W31]|uniref:L-threonylcarbamoyladenylate synthase n=1 Tax=Marinicella sp. W31 TaxID=3023713 RepID=UPI00375730AB